MPGVSSLIIGTVHSEDSLIAAVAHPQPPEIPGHEGVDERQEHGAESSGGETGLECLAIQDKLLEPGIEPSIRTVFEEPFSKTVLHSSSLSISPESSFCLYSGTSVPSRMRASVSRSFFIVSMSSVNSVVKGSIASRSAPKSDTIYPAVSVDGVVKSSRSASLSAGGVFMGVLTCFFSNPFSMNHRGSSMEEIQSKEHLVLHRLSNFYSHEASLVRVRDIIAGNSKLSLRLIDWLVTNYAKKHNVSYMTTTGRHVIIYLAYKAHLKAYSKKMFDPFCRWKRIQFLEMNTTVGQLNFFEWAIQDEVLDYLETNYEDIQRDMDECSTTITPKEGERRKRHELSRSATKAVCMHNVTVKVTFN